MNQPIETSIPEPTIASNQMAQAFKSQISDVTGSCDTGVNQRRIYQQLLQHHESHSFTPKKLKTVRINSQNSNGISYRSQRNRQRRSMHVRNAYICRSEELAIALDSEVG
jgi:hypothetical protein